MTRRLRRVALYVVVAAWLAAILGPYAVMLMTSLTPADELVRQGGMFIPEDVSTQSYADLLDKTPFLTYMANSVLVAVGTVIVALAAALSAGIALSRYRFPGRMTILTGLLVAQLIPAVLLVISLQGQLREFGLLNSRFGLLLVHATIATPFAAWLLKGFLDKIPAGLEEASRIDGANSWQVFRYILAPLTLPGLAAAATYVFIFSWNEFIYAVTFAAGDETRTIPVGLQLFIGDYQIRWDLLTAGGVLAALPVLVGFMFVQRSLVAGLTAGAVRG